MASSWCALRIRNDVAGLFRHSQGACRSPAGRCRPTIDFNNAHAAKRCRFFNQDIFELAQSLAPVPTIRSRSSGGMTYNQALDIDQETPECTASTRR